MEGELISVIIPVYGVEKYLEKCVDSVLAQTYENLEIILVDDGSPDKCPAICDAFAARDSRVKALHKANGGQGSARNRGLDIAHGACVGFVDADDYIAPDMYAKLYEAMLETGAQISMCDFVHVDETGAKVSEMPPLRTGVLTKEEMFSRIEDVERGRYVSPVLRLCRRELFDGLRFEEDMRYEDEMLAHLLYDRCEHTVIIPDAAYFYVQRGGSTTHQPASIRRLDAVRAIMARYDFFMANGYTDLASRTVRYAGQKLWLVLTSVNVWRYRKQIWPWFRRVAAAALRHFGPCVSAVAGYAFRSVRGAGKGSGTE